MNAQWGSLNQRSSHPRTLLSVQAAQPGTYSPSWSDIIVTNVCPEMIGLILRKKEEFKKIGKRYKQIKTNVSAAAVLLIRYRKVFYSIPDMQICSQRFLAVTNWLHRQHAKQTKVHLPRIAAISLLQRDKNTAVSGELWKVTKLTKVSWKHKLKTDLRRWLTWIIKKCMNQIRWVH